MNGLIKGKSYLYESYDRAYRNRIIKIAERKVCARASFRRLSFQEPHRSKSWSSQQVVMLRAAAASGGPDALRARLLPYSNSQRCVNLKFGRKEKFENSACWVYLKRYFWLAVTWAFITSHVYIFNILVLQKLGSF